jgi:DNA-directed RNA polymerase alpha subunit
MLSEEDILNMALGLVPLDLREQSVLTSKMRYHELIACHEGAFHQSSRFK